MSRWRRFFTPLVVTRVRFGDRVEWSEHWRVYVFGILIASIWSKPE